MAQTTTIHGHTFTFGQGVKLCTQCDALVTGVPGGDEEFARCGACTRIMERGFGRDPEHPHTGIRTKSAENQRDAMRRRCRNLALLAVDRFVTGYEGFSFTFKAELAERLIGAPLY